MLPVCKLWIAQNLFRPARLCFNQPYLRGVHVNDNNVLVGGSVIMAFWKLMCIPSVSAQPCSNDANLLLAAPWAQQVGWNLSVATSNWTGVSCSGAFVSQV